MLTPGTKIKSTFTTDDCCKGEIVSFQEETSVFACGYFVKFPDGTIFLNKRVVDKLYTIDDDKIDEDIYEVKDNGQISFI